MKKEPPALTLMLFLFSTPWVATDPFTQYLSGNPFKTHRLGVGVFVCVGEHFDGTCQTGTMF